MRIQTRPIDRNGRALAGRGPVELVDEQGVTRPMPGGIPSRGRSLYLEALEPGGGLRARLAGLEAPLLVQVVEDAAISLAVGVQHSAGKGWYNLGSGTVCVSSHGHRARADFPDSLSR